MADSTIAGLPLATTIADDDVIPFTDISDTTEEPTGKTKKITKSNLVAGGDVTAPAAHSANYVPQWNATPNSKTLVEGFTITAAGKALIDDADAAAQRTTLGLGTAATRAAEDSMTDGSKLPDGHAIKTYGDANWSGGGNVPAGSQGDMLYKGASAWLAGNMFINAAAYTGTDRAKIQAAITEAQTNGGIVYIPAGTWTVDDHDSDGNCLEITDGITVIGEGEQKTILETASTTANIIEINTTIPVKISDMHIKCTGTPTAGAGIKVTSATENGRSLFDNLRFYHTYYGIQFERASWWTVRDSHFIGIKKYGLLVRNTHLVDSGDQFVRGCTFATEAGWVADAAVRHESGGGLKFVQNKINGDFPIGYDLAIEDGVVTSVLLINSNSIELSSDNYYPINLDCKGTTGTYGKITIIGNEINRGRIFIDGAAGDTTIYMVTISGNVLYRGGVKINNGKFVNITDNIFAKGTLAYGIENVGGTYIRAFGNEFWAWTTGQTTGAISNKFYEGDSWEFHADSTNAIMSVYGFAAADLGEIRLMSNNSKRAGLAASDALTYLDYTGTLNFRSVPNAYASRMTLDASGNLNAAGNITATGNCCVDYVFEDRYELMSLDQLHAFINDKNHLPNIIIGQNDKVDLIDSVTQLLEKTEEQALYILQLHQRLKTLEAK